MTVVTGSHSIQFTVYSMTRTTHKSHPTPSFPVYCLDWADDQTLLLGGGGGASRSGISNMLVRISLHVSPSRRVTEAR